jgi:hypothetical protein
MIFLNFILCRILNKNMNDNRRKSFETFFLQFLLFSSLFHDTSMASNDHVTVNTSNPWDSSTLPPGILRVSNCSENTGMAACFTNHRLVNVASNLGL